MRSGETVNPSSKGVASFLDRLDTEPFSKRHLLVIISCFATLFLDGMDVSAPQVGASAILKSWGSEVGTVAERFSRWGWAVNPLGLLFSASNLGIIAGIVGFAAVSDRYGRKVALVAGIFLYSLPGCLAAFAHSPDQLILLRLITGLGIGGVLPSVVALMAESMPVRNRAGLILLTLAAYAVGGIVSGILAAQFIPRAGWSIVFLIPGLLGLFLGVFLLIYLPESIRFLIAKKPDSTQLRELITRHYEAYQWEAEADAPLQIGVKQTVSTRELFAGSLAWLTPLLWLGYFAISTAFLALLSWQTVILEKLGLTFAQASLAFSLSSFSAVALQLGIARVLDKLGPTVAVLTSGAALAALLAMAHFPYASIAAKFALIMIGNGCASVTLHLYSTTAGLFYPTRIRGRGVGWASGLGRIGSIVGPLTVAHFFSESRSVSYILMAIAAPYFLAIPVCFWLGAGYRHLRVRGIASL